MNILSLTGGGYRGVFSLNVLLQLEQYYMKYKNIDSCVDIYAGTSAGAIIAAGLAFGKSVREIEDKFVEYGPSIFKYHLPFNSTGPGLFWNRYSNRHLRLLLEDILGKDSTLRDAKKPLILTAVDIETAAPIVMSCYPNTFGYSGLHYENMNVVDAVIASAAAPTYFPAVRPNFPREVEYTGDIIGYKRARENPSQSWLSDGGLVANAPDLLAASEAMITYGIPFDEINMLSIGTTKYTHDLKKKRFFKKEARKKRWGMAQWIFWPRRTGYIIDVMMHAQVLLAERLLGKILDKDNYIRLDFQMPAASKIDIDDTTQTNELIYHAREIVHEFMENVAFDPHRLQLFLDRLSTSSVEY